MSNVAADARRRRDMKYANYTVNVVYSISKSSSASTLERLFGALPTYEHDSRFYISTCESPSWIL